MRKSFSLSGILKTELHMRQLASLERPKSLDGFSGKVRGTQIPDWVFVHSGKLESSKYCFS